MTEKVIRIMPCLDLRDGRVVKGVRFVNLRDAGDPVECAQAYGAEGADELAVLDITATVRGERPARDVVRTVAEAAQVPVTAGGGVARLSDVEALLDAGAQRVSIGTAAVRNPRFVEEAAVEFGTERIAVAIDADASDEVPSGFEVFVHGGRTPTRIDAVEFAREAQDRGAGMLIVTSIRTDGTREGYDIELLRAVTGQVGVPVVASGGAGAVEHFYEAATKGGAEVLLAASVFHFGEIRIPKLKAYLKERGLNVRL